MTKRAWIHYASGEPIPGCVLDEFYIDGRTNIAYRQELIDWDSVCSYSFVSEPKKPATNNCGAYKTALSEAVEFGHWDIVQVIAKRLQEGAGE
jgi:hypothetical protein